VFLVSFGHVFFHEIEETCWKLTRNCAKDLKALAKNFEKPSHLRCLALNP